jgi:predicted negative regulator of RcsB-dependent stress response
LRPACDPACNPAHRNTFATGASPSAIKPKAFKPKNSRPMATQLDLQEQEQLDALKSFWKTYGNLVTWTLVLVLGAFAAWNGWQYWQREQASQAGAMFEELERAALAGDTDKTTRVFADLKERFPRTAFAQQGGLLAAKLQFDKGQADAARASLAWVATTGAEVELRTVAQLRLAGLQAEAKQFDEAIKSLDAATAPSFAALVADRRGDVLMLQGKKDEAKVAYQAAYKAMGDKVDYRRLIDAKLTALGAAPEAIAAPASAASAASGTAP